MNIQQLSTVMRCLGYGGLECYGSPFKTELLQHALSPWKRHVIWGILETIFSIVLRNSLWHIY
jgi:hypothetical protein